MSDAPRPQPANEHSAASDELPLAHLLVQLGAEVAAPLAQALERLHEQLAQVGGSPDASPLLALRDPLRRARDASLLAAQVGRLRTGRVVAAQERCSLHGVLHQVVEVRRREANRRGLQLRLDSVDADIVSDPALLPSLLHALLDWALWHTRSSIELSLGITPWPPHARLQCRFALRDLDQESDNVVPLTLDGLRWMLIVHTAAAMGLSLKRADEAGICVTRIEFPLMRREHLPDLPLPDPEPATVGQDTQPFAGWLAMVVSADAGFQRRITEAMQPLGWALDRTHSIDEAFQHCLDALPQAIVVDSALAGPDLKQWRCHVLADAPGFCFIEVGVQAPAGARRSDDGLFCRAAQLESELPALLRAALAPRGAGEALTFRL